MAISDALARKLATYVVLTRRVENRAIRQILQAADRYWENYRRRAERLGTAGPLDILLYEFRVHWQPSKTVAELQRDLLRLLEELGRGAVLVAVDEILRHRPGLRDAVTRSMEEAFAFFGRPGEALFDAVVAGHTFTQVLERLFERLGLRLEGQIREQWGQAFHAALMEGLSPREAAAEASRRAGFDWEKIGRLLRENAWQVERVVRTHAMAAVNTAQHLFCRALASRGLVVGERWVATPDLLTCTDCAALDGKVWYFEDQPNVKDRPPLPRHPNCRCTIVPVLAPEYDPEPIRVFGYEEWFEGLSPEQQKELLGEEGYKAWRRGTPLSVVLTAPPRTADVAAAVAAATGRRPPPGPNFAEFWGEMETYMSGPIPSEPLAQLENEVAAAISAYWEKLREVWPSVTSAPKMWRLQLNLGPMELGRWLGLYEARQKKIFIDLGGIMELVRDSLREVRQLEAAGVKPPAWNPRMNAVHLKERTDPRLYIAAFLRHELGHHLHYLLYASPMTVELDPAEVRHRLAYALGVAPEELQEAYKKVTNFCASMKNWIEQNVSLYGGSSVTEAFAEVVALYTGPYYEGQLPREVEAALDVLLGGRERVEYIRQITKDLAITSVDTGPLEG